MWRLYEYHTIRPQIPDPRPTEALKSICASAFHCSQYSYWLLRVVNIINGLCNNLLISDGENGRFKVCTVPNLTFRFTWDVLELRTYRAVTYIVDVLPSFSFHVHIPHANKMMTTLSCYIWLIPIEEMVSLSSKKLSIGTFWTTQKRSSSSSS